MSDSRATIYPVIPSCCLFPEQALTPHHRWNLQGNVPNQRAARRSTEYAWGPLGLPLSTRKHMHMKKLLEAGEGDARKDQGSTSTVYTVTVPTNPEGPGEHIHGLHCSVPTNLDDVPHLTGHQAEYSTRFCFNIVKVRPKLMLHAF